MKDREAGSLADECKRDVGDTIGEIHARFAQGMDEWSRECDAVAYLTVLVPVDRRGEPHLSDKLVGRAPQRREDLFGEIHLHTHVPMIASGSNQH